MRDLPVVLWLLALVGVALAHPFVPAPRWLMIHLLLLGAASHAILVWSRHFADALLHASPREGERRVQSIRLLLLNLGVLAVVTGVVGDVWPVTVLGAGAVAGAVVWHGVSLVLLMRRSLPSRFGVTVRYYVAAACFLPVGATLGTVLARGLGDPLHEQVVVAHATVNLLGWMGLTVLGTLVTLWPTMLRTRIAAGSEAAARRALPVLAGSVVVTALAALWGLRPVAALGLVGYLAGVALLAAPLAVAARTRPPHSFPTWSVLAGVLWLVGCLAALAVGLATAPSWVVAGDRFSWLTPFLAAGFAAQVLLGALSYLVPVALGGGPAPVRAANTVLDRGAALRVTTANAGLLVCALPVPSLVRVICSALVLVALAAFVPLLFAALRASRRARSASPVHPPEDPPAEPPRRRPRGPAAPSGERPPGQVHGLAATGLAAVVLAVAVGVALDPGALPGGGTAAAASAGVSATGATTTVRVEAANMRFTPGTVSVPAGNRLVIEVTNTDHEDVHDLVLDSGATSGRLAPGASARLDVGVVGRDVEGWCSVVGHRQMGMVLHIDVTGTGDAASGAGGHADHAHGPAGAAMTHGAEPSASPAAPRDDVPRAVAPDFLAAPDPGFVAHDAVLPPLEAARVHRRTLTVRELDREVAPGVTQRLWTFDGSAPGPVLHGRVGDVFVITLVNDGTIGHSIDFHAGSLAPDRPMRTIAPGGSLVYRFRATRAGVWMYHCSSMPMSAHIANGLFGAVVIEPPGLPGVDRSYVLAQSELYLGADGGPVDMGKLQAERPDAVVFNGYAHQYDHRPLAVRVGERVRIWVLDAGPNRATSFHVVGGQFDTVYAEGAYLLRPGAGAGGSQSLALQPAQGGFVELSFPEAGHYPFVSHVMVDAERGAHGLFDVRP
ncbi:multicopper oxidase domain-containing protein [Nocardioides mesophilus]|uniref:Copper-containing nitrite reductase n=1 Tax=Nocardioides mesophilus TaxID=433659 RepID=A0A7G9RHE6_9ACTN|nr:multicopper oxidase domain-containing protein [Nocardioides mesophilus]